MPKYSEGDFVIVGKGNKFDSILGFAAKIKHVMKNRTGSRLTTKLYLEVINGRQRHIPELYISTRKIMAIPVGYILLSTNRIIKYGDMYVRVNYNDSVYWEYISDYVVGKKCNTIQVAVIRRKS